MICLIHQANLLLDRQILALEQSFIEEAAIQGKLATERLKQRRKDHEEQPNRTDQTNLPPKCPRCESLMALRTAKSGKNSGSRFWGCTRYPDCKGTAPI